MKRVALLSFLTAAILVAGTPAFAEGDHPGFDPDKRIEVLKEKLSLSDDQVTKLKAHFAAKKAEREAAMKKNREEMAAILTPEQMAKFDDMIKAKKEGWKEMKRDRHEKKG